MRTRDVLLLISVLVAIGGCAGTTGNPKLQVKIPDTCERNAKTVPQPSVETDPVVTIGKTRAALGIANRTIVNTRSCIKGVRERFAKGG